jgi:hypothetical protein
MRLHRASVLALAVSILASTAFADSSNPATTAPTAAALTPMPVKEITVFKDGHTLLLHAGTMPTDAAGNVLLDQLPSPVLGTFWPYSADPAVKLTAVTAGQRRVSVTRTSLSLPDLLRANIGARVQVKFDNADYEGTVEKILDHDSVADPSTQTGDEVSPNIPAPEQPLLLLKIGTGTKVMPLNQIESFLFESPDYKTSRTSEESKNLLTLKLQWPNNKPQPAADVGMMYLQKGIRWIPSYKITLDGNGHAQVQLQATLVNELIDLHDVTANLVIGVPSFAFAGQTDPIGLQQTLTQLSPYFQQRAATAYAMSNAIMSQAAAPAGAAMDEARSNDTTPELTGSAKNEDLFVFTVTHLTLKNGDRMVVPITAFTLPYTDVYTLDIPVTPPPEVWQTFGTQQQTEIARLARAPKVIHTLRISNTSDFPLTTAPALLMRDDKVLAQSLVEYTPIHGSLDLPLTTAVDVLVKKTDHESKRTPNAVRWNSDEYTRIDLSSAITLTNHRNTPVLLEIKRSLLGQVDTADNDGHPDMLNPFEDDSYLPTATADNQPGWWNWYSWPNWWSHFNGIGQVSWKATLDPGKELTLNYTWHYFWR